jgi:hypothetical protein
MLLRSGGEADPTTYLAKPFVGEHFDAGALKACQDWDAHCGNPRATYTPGTHVPLAPFPPLV